MHARPQGSSARLLEVQKKGVGDLVVVVVVNGEDKGEKGREGCQLTSIGAEERIIGVPCFVFRARR